MSLAEKLLDVFMKLPKDKKKEAIDFIEYLHMKNQNELEKMGTSFTSVKNTVVRRHKNHQNVYKIYQLWL